MKFIRFLKKEDKQIASIPQQLGGNFSNSVLPTDILHGFDTKKCTLSLFGFTNDDEKKRIICHFEFNQKKLLGISKKISYLILEPTYLTQINNSFVPVLKPLVTFYDPVVQNLHYDLINLDTSLLVNLIYKLNTDILANPNLIHTLKAKGILDLVKTLYSPTSPELLKTISPETLNEYFLNLVP